MKTFNTHQMKNMAELLAALNTKRFDTALAEAQKYIYMSAFQSVRYNQSKAAKALGVSRGTFRTRLNEYLEEGK